MTYYKPKPDEAINDKIIKLNEDTFDVKSYNHKCIKVKVLRDITKKLNIPKDDLNYGNDQTINLEDDDYDLIKSTFGTRLKKKPENMHEFNKLHINMIRSIAPVIETKRKKINQVDTIFYYYNNELINENK